MTTPAEPAIPNGTPVAIDIAQGLAVAKGVIADAYCDSDGWMYRVEIRDGDPCDEHRNAEGELWVCAFEVTPIADTPAGAEHP